MGPVDISIFFYPSLHYLSSNVAYYAFNMWQTSSPSPCAHHTHLFPPLQLLLQGTLGDYANSMFSKPWWKKGHWKSVSGGLVFVGNTAAELGRILNLNLCELGLC